MYFKKVLALMVIFMFKSVFAQDRKFPSTNIKENIKIISSSGQINVDEVANILRIGKCDMKIDPVSNENSNYCDFLNGKEGSVFKHYFEFENLNKTSMYISKVIAKDHILIKINGVTVYSSTSEDNLSIDYSVKFDDKITDEPFDFYYGIMSSKKVISVQSAKTINLNPNIDMTKHLKSGTNRVEIQVAVGYFGGYQVDISFGSQANYKEQYRCTDTTHNCSQNKEMRIVDGVYVSRDCWQTSYAKTCIYPSKNDCSQYANDPNCYLIQDKQCLFKDSSANCVNVLREYSCHKGNDEYEVKRPKYISQNEDSTIPGGLKCKAIPCFDGNCGKNEWDKDSDMMSSTSKLKVARESGGKDLNTIALFPGTKEICSIKIASSSNCCKIKGNGKLKEGWSHKLGSKCSKEEIELSKKREKNLCVYVGKKINKILGVQTFQKNFFCCFPNHLFKVIQTQGRKQLADKGISFSNGSLFGSGDNPICRGLNLNELQNIDFNKLDFSDAFPEIIEKIKIPSDIDIKSRVNKNIPKDTGIHGDLPSQTKRPKRVEGHYGVGEGGDKNANKSEDMYE